MVASLKSCANMKDIHAGTRIHDDIVKRGLLVNNTYVANTLVSMYAKCGALADAHNVLDRLHARDVVSWSALLAAYAQKGLGEEVLKCYQRMKDEGLSLDAIAYSCILKACGITRAVEKGKQIHEEIVRQGLLRENVVLGTALVDMYVKFGAVAIAEQVHNELSVRNTVSWSVLIAAYVEEGQGNKALNCYDQMQSEGFSSNAVTYSCILKACGMTRQLFKGRMVHEEIVSQGLLVNDVVVGTALIDMYAKCGVLTKAQQVLDGLPMRNVVSWSALIAGYVQEELGEEALECYEKMRSQGLSPNAFTYAGVLGACGLIGAVYKGEQVHNEIVIQGLLQDNVVLGTALVDMYAKFGALTKAAQVLEELPSRNIVSWSALIAGYVQEGKGNEALNCYDKMQNEGVSPNAITYACILKACGITQDVERGKRVHDEIVNQGLFENDIVLGSALVDMYAKCGVLTKARQLFDELPVRNKICWSALIAGYAEVGQVEESQSCFKQMQGEGLTPDIVCWSALIGGYARQGRAEEAIYCFHQMLREGITPNSITFFYVFNACSHSGLVDEAEAHFESMSKAYGIMPDKGHHTCMVDLFARVGHFDKAMGVIKKMPSSDYPPIWSVLLSACVKWGNVNLARLAFENVVRLDEHCARAFPSMINSIALAGMEKDARKIEATYEENAAWNLPGGNFWADEGGNSVLNVPSMYYVPTNHCFATPSV